MYGNYTSKREAAETELRELEKKTRRSNLWTKVAVEAVTILAMVGAGTLIVGLSVGVLTLLGVYG